MRAVPVEDSDDSAQLVDDGDVTGGGDIEIADSAELVFGSTGVGANGEILSDSPSRRVSPGSVSAIRNELDASAISDLNFF